ncbi:Protein kinase domain-containing protein [Aphelenchoides besseyi]|nr:Protein kinase domain-containing protein [Aphelenchoides besseyi]
MTSSSEIASASEVEDSCFDEMIVRRHEKSRRRRQNVRMVAGRSHVESEVPQTSASRPTTPVPVTNVYAEPNANPIVDENTRRRMSPKLILNNELTLFGIGDTVRNCWEIKGLIGSGGYGQIYYSIDNRNGRRVAVKAEPVHRQGRRHRRMILEQHVLVRLQGQPHVPLIYGSGCQQNVNFIVMQLLSVNIGDLRKSCPLKRLSRSTCGRFALQVIAALRDLHNCGFLHRDIKPANICFGVTELSKHRLFLVDYGLARSFRTPDGRPRERRQRAGFRGTLRYVSMRVHDREEQGPADDLISLFYSLLELLRGDVPWKQLHNANQIKVAKEQMRRDDFLQVCQHFGEPLREFGRAVYCMNSTDEPNYTALQDVMRAFSGNVPLDGKYDWEMDYADVYSEEDINRHLKLIS